MIDILNRYLIQNRSINIPGLGTIYMESVPASTDFTNRQIFPPTHTYRFDKYFDSPDKDFFAYLAAKKNIADYEAIQLYNEFAQDIRSTIKTANKAEWKDVGTFTKNESGDIVLEVATIKPLFDPVAAERVIRSNAAHSILVGDATKTNIQMTELLQEDEQGKGTGKRWWIYALVLLVVALLVLAIQLYKHGFSLHAVSSEQKVDIEQPRQ